MQFHFVRVVATMLLFQLTCLHAMAQDQGASMDSVLQDYVKSEDTAFKWEVEIDQETPQMRYVVLNLTSQKWLDQDRVNRTEWNHWLELFIPNPVQTEVALLFITGGSNDNAQPSLSDSPAMQIAMHTGNVVAQLRQVPNQPLRFLGDSMDRSEDDLIAFSWTQYLETNDTNWIAQLPMTKSAVRAMDAITEVLKLDEFDNQVIEEFVVAGGSKRGWTTWLTAVADERVIAIVPIVYDVLNSQESMRHHFEAYGYWSPSVGDYVNHKILPRLHSGELEELFVIVDPFSYRERLALPKFIVNSTGDEFFLPDSSQFYWDDLVGEKRLRYVSNSDHGLGGTDAVESLGAYFALIAKGEEVPSIHWTRENTRSIEIRTSREPIDAKLWVAHNPTSRDFRLLRWGSGDNDVHGPIYKEHNLDSVPGDPLTFRGSLSGDEPGWSAWLAEFAFDVGLPFPLKLTTDVQVDPVSLPFNGKDFSAETFLTIHCSQDEFDMSDADTVLDFLDSNFEKSKYVFVHGGGKGRVYFTWKQTQDLRAEGRAVADLLESLGYSDCQYQIESGGGPTLPPL